MVKEEQLFDRVESDLKLTSSHNGNDVQKSDDLVINHTNLIVPNMEVTTGNNHQISGNKASDQVMECEVVSRL